MRSIFRGFIFVWLCRLEAGELQDLGRQLFFDKRLSTDGTISCGSCHRPDRAFSDPRPVSIGVGNRKGKLNAPALVNLKNAKRFFWDGRATSLEQQARGPLLNEIEMGNRQEDLEWRLQALPEYSRRFKKVFGDDRITLERISKAIAAYEKTLSSDQSLYDKWRVGQRQQWTQQHELGRQLFFGQASCSECHSGQNFTNHQMAPNDHGTMLKVPTLRDLLRTAPYLHDGSKATLLEVLETHKRAARLTDPERRALLRFLESLSATDWN